MTTEKFRNKYRIPSTRLQNWNYGWAGAYFITICTKNRVKYFGDISHGRMHLSHIGVLADVFWYEIKNHALNVELGAFVVMPNHVHGILILHNGNDNDNDANGNNENDNVNDYNDVNGNGNGNVNGNINGNVGGNVGGNVDGNVETRHALSLQSPQSPQPSQSKPSQPSDQPPPTTIGQQRFQNQGKNTVSSIIGSYKSAVSKHAHRLGFDFVWQERFYDHIIRNEKSYLRISRYIINNPLNWREDRFYE